jgi:hypothetical protein
MTQRIDQLDGPPVVGAFYLVPCVRGWWKGKIDWWPVMGPKHDDRKFFHFPWEHYHLDRRFLPAKLQGFAVATPLHEPHPSNQCAPALSEPVWRRRRCKTDTMHFPTHPEAVVKLQESLLGKTCPRSPHGGWICPHRRFDLSSIRPGKDGRIICPLHGLTIHAESGEVVLTAQVAWEQERRAEVEKFARELAAWEAAE